MQSLAPPDIHYLSAALGWNSCLASADHFPTPRASLPAAPCRSKRDPDNEGRPGRYPRSAGGLPRSGIDSHCDSGTRRMTCLPFDTLRAWDVARSGTRAVPARSSFERIATPELAECSVCAQPAARRAFPAEAPDNNLSALASAREGGTSARSEARAVPQRS